MATTARLPEALKLEADAYAQALGISLNALLAVALRDYLDARKPGAAARPGVLPVVTPAPPAAGPATVRPPKNPRALCPCGSGDQWRHCHGHKDGPLKS